MNCRLPANIKSSLLASRVLATLLLITWNSEVLAQVLFTVSPDSKQLTAKFLSDELTEVLDEGEVKPADILKIYGGVERKEEIGGLPAVIGSYSSSAGQVVFQPLVPFSEELPYLIIFGDTLEHKFKIDVPSDRLRTRLLQAYPSTDTVPANLLKIYLQFSAPMREGEVYERVGIYNSQGNRLKDPFVPLHPELWDSSGCRVTLWLDPGRVKRALLSRETHGPVLETGKTYRLKVDSQWKDTNGQPLETGFTKEFHVKPDDRIKPETENWTLTPPAANTRKPLLVNFGETLDYATALNAFRVKKINGQDVPGSLQILEDESGIIYGPINSWFTGLYILIINSKLEDMAGNNLNRLFDRDLTSETDLPSEKAYYEIEFEVSE